MQWRFAGTFAGVVSRFVVGVLLSRLLTPADFGIAALALIVVGFAQPLGDFGMTSAIVQRRDLTERHVRAAFTLSVIIGIAIAVGLALAAPLAAVVLHDARVTPVLRVLSAGFALQGPSVVAVALLRRRLDFRRLFFIDTASYALAYGVVAVLLAVQGRGVWSLVWGALAQTGLSSGLQLIASRHAMRPLLARREVGELLHFGVGFGAGSWINYVAQNADNFVVGRLLGAASLGLYARAYTLMNLPYTYVASVLSGVLFPAFARIQDDIPRLRGAYLLMTQIIALAAGGAMGTLAIAAPHLVPALYGPRWIGVVAPLQILCAAGYFRAVSHAGNVLAQSAGFVYADLRRQAFYAGSIVVGALVGSRYDVVGAAAGVGIAIVAMFVATGQLALRITRTPWPDYVRAQRDALAIAAVTCGGAIAARVALEMWGSAHAAIALGTVGAAAVPWLAGVAWKLGDPELRVVTARLPAWCRRMADTLRGRVLPGNSSG